MRALPVTTLRVLTREDLNAAIDIQTRAFVTDPLWVWLYPDASRRRRSARLLFAFTYRLAIAARQGYGAGDPLGGVAVWSLPDQKTPLRAFVTSQPWRLLFRRFTLQVFRAAPVFGQFERMHAAYVNGPHYYLNTVSVAPERQGQGLSSQLIRPFLAEADRVGLPVYTETMTPENVPVYEHFGFTVMEDYAVPKTDLHIWSLRREASPGR